MSLGDDEEGYVWHKESHMVKIKIPDGCVKCPDCKGSGEFRLGWDMRNSFMSCLTCSGRGYVEKGVLELRKK